MTERHVFVPEAIDRASFNIVGSMLPTIALSGTTMGTTWSLKYITRATIQPQAVEEALQHIFTTIIAQMSGWDPASELSRFNKLEAGQSLTISQEFQTVLKRAVNIRDETDRAFDPFCGVAVHAWGFGPDGLPDTLPDTQNGTQNDTGALSTATPTAQIPTLKTGGALYQPGGVYIDLSAIAKGYTVDLCANTLSQMGLDSFLMEIGGEFRAKGVRTDAQPWWVTLEAAPNMTTHTVPKTVIALYELSLATSGAYRREATIGNRYTTHIIDPLLQQPRLGNLASVSVLHTTCMGADAYATALFAMGETRGIAFANQYGLAAIFRFISGQETISDAAKAMQT